MTNPGLEIQNLRRLLEVTQQMAVTTDLHALLTTIVDAAREVLQCERATIFLHDAATRELYSFVATGAAPIRLPIGTGLAGAAAVERRLLNIPDAYADSRFRGDFDRRTGFRTRNLLCFPLENLSGELMGVLQALNKHNGAFNSDDEELSRVLGAQAGVALHRWKLLEEFAIKQRMQRDLELARRIQRDFLPKSNPKIAGYDIAGWNLSADETGGDCFDFLPLPDGRLGILLADAMGHGIGAALVVAEWRSLVRAMLSLSADLGQVVDQVNRMLARDLGEERFVTGFIGILDPETGRIEYISAGQGPLLLVTKDTVDRRLASGPPFAVIREFEYGVETADLPRGGMLALLTDGFFDTLSNEDNHYGTEPVVAVLQHGATMQLEGLIERLHKLVTDCSGTGPQMDDLTAVLIRRTT